MKNFIAKGEVLTVTAGVSGIDSGSVVVAGGLVGVATISGAEGDMVSVALDGVYELAKANVLVAQGAKVYYDSTNKNITNVAAGNTFAGFAFEGALQAATTILVKLECNCVATGQIANIAAEATANGSDAATTQALANALKTKVNAILAALKTSGLMIAD